MIEPPPKSSDGLNVEHPIRSMFYGHFAQFFNVLEDHYSSRFDWLSTEIQSSKRIAVIGSSKGGAEAFALMWHIGSEVSIGFDKKLSSIKQSLRNRRVAISLVDDWVPQVMKHSDNTYKRKFQDWYIRSVKSEIRSRILPNFVVSDIEVALACQDGYFAACYSRYLLDKIQKDLRHKAVQEMFRVTAIGGLVVIVAPDRAFSFDPSSFGATLVKEVGPEELGDLEWKDNPPVGRIYQKMHT